MIDKVFTPSVPCSQHLNAVISNPYPLQLVKQVFARNRVESPLKVQTKNESSKYMSAAKAGLACGGCSKCLQLCSYLVAVIYCPADGVCSATGWEICKLGKHVEHLRNRIPSFPTDQPNHRFTNGILKRKGGAGSRLWWVVLKVLGAKKRCAAFQQPGAKGGL